MTSFDTNYGAQFLAAGALKSVFLAGTALTAAMAVPAAYAQAPMAESQAADNAQEAGGIQDIVVTAQRREQRLQDVPIAVAALNSDALSNTGINKTESLQAAVPGLQIPRAQFALQPRIRGVGSTVVGAGQENSVALYVDEVYIGTAAATALSFNNIDRVEVLKGPQGTLFGRNATGGLIQVITKEPSLTGLEGEVKARIGNYLTYGGDLYLSGPLAENVAISIAAQGSRQERGYGKNIFDNSKYGQNHKDISVRGKLLWEISDRTKANFSVDYYERKFDLNYIRDPAFALSPAAQAALAVAQLSNPTLNATIPAGGYDVNQDFDGLIDQNGYGLSMRLEHDLDAVSIKSITAYRNDRAPNQSDLDLLPVRVLHLGIPRLGVNSTGRQFTQELQLLSSKNSAFNWIVGAYYFHSDYGNDSLLGFGFPLTIPGASGFGATQQYNGITGKTESYAAFGQASYEFGPQTTLTGGFRYSYEKRKLGGELTNYLTTDPTGAGANPFPFTQTYDKSASFKAPTWRISLDHRFSNEVMVYASYNRGFKSGGFDLSSPDEPAFRPEKLDAFEIGLKTDLFDRRVRFNAAGFYYNHRNLQVSVPGQGVIRTENAAEAELYGFDADLTVEAAAGLVLSANAAYVHARYKEFPNAVCTDLTPGPTYLLQGSCAAQGISVVGNHVQYTPTFTGGVGANYTAALSNGAGSIDFAARFYYSSKQYALPENLQMQKAYELLNASITWRSEGDRFSVRLYGDNLTDQYYATQQTIINAITAYKLPGAPRTYGLEFGVKF